MTNKSYWQSAYVGSDKAKENVKSWFSPLCEGLTPYKAEILCDIETDREKKIRAFMTDADGKHYQLERTRGGKKFSVSRKCIKPGVVGCQNIEFGAGCAAAATASSTTVMPDMVGAELRFASAGKISITSEAVSGDGEYLVVGGEGFGFGLVAACLRKADAETIVASQARIEDVRRMAQGYADFWQSKAAGEHCSHYEVLSSQFQNIADRLGR